MTRDELDSLHADVESTIEHTNISIRFAIETLHTLQIEFDNKDRWGSVHDVQYKISELQKQLTDDTTKS